jgi:predicted ATPase/DNA-binding SARP family transcriptional activator
VEFRILGPFELEANGERISLGGTQQRAVLALLLAAAGESVPIDRIVDELWGERPPASGHHAVQVHISKLRKILAGTSSRVELRRAAGGYALHTDPGQIDAVQFASLVATAERTLANDPGASAAVFANALALWRGAPLSEFAEYGFARRESERLAEVRSTAIAGLTEARLMLGQHSEAIAEIAQLVSDNPLQERPRRLLMLALYGAGRHSDALREYRDACAALDEIGLQPSPALRDLEAAILRHDATLSGTRSAALADGPATRGVSGQSRLPASADRFVGRVAEREAILELLIRGARLLTLLGPGGSGKTRLALEVAHEFARRGQFVWFVGLEPLNDPGLVASEIARAGGIDEVPGEGLEVTLSAGLADRELLLVLDNFEHLIASAPMVGRLLSVARGLSVLVTSREALRINGEHRVAVEGLPPADAAELFTARARAVRAESVARPEETDAVARTCRRLDGLPLALELAAAQVALFSVTALDERLRGTLDLSPGVRGAPERQRTLRATIDWSYRLLSEHERQLFAALGRFAGGARLGAIAAVHPTGGPDLIATVAGLVDKSMLQRREDPDRQPRFWMLQTIREHANEMALVRDEADTVADRHAGHFAALADQASGHLRSADQREWLQRLDRDYDNLRIALDHLIVADPPQALRMAAALGRFWEARRHHEEGLERLRRVLHFGSDDVRAAAHATAHAGRLAYLKGDWESAEALFIQALALARESDETLVEVLALGVLGSIADGRGKSPRGIELYEQALSAAERASDEHSLLVAAGNLGAALLNATDPLGGQVARRRGRALLEESLRISRRVGDAWNAAAAAANLAELLLADEEVFAAESLIADAINSAHESGNEAMAAVAIALEALIALKRADLTVANSKLRMSLELIRAYPDVERTQLGVTVGAAIATAAGAPARAAQLWSALEQIRARGMPEWRTINRLRDEYLPIGQAAIDPDTWDTAWRAGARLTNDAALSLAGTT